jgi:hypothetical protein
MKSMPVTTFRGVFEICKGYYPALRSDRLESFLNGQTEKPILVSELMLITGKCKTAVKNRLRDAGVQPVGLGGKTGKENLYSRNDALQALEVI